MVTVLGAPELTGLPFSEERTRRTELFGVESPPPPRLSEVSLGATQLRNGLLAPVKSLGGLIRKSSVPRLDASESDWFSPPSSFRRAFFLLAAWGFRGMSLEHSFLAVVRGFTSNLPLVLAWAEIMPVAHRPHSRGKYLLGIGGAHILRRPQKLLFFPVSLPHLNLDLLLARSWAIYSGSTLLALKSGCDPFPRRYFNVFFMKGTIEVSKSWNFWFLVIMRLNKTRWVESTRESPRRRMVSSCLPLHKVQVNSKNLKGNFWLK